MAERQVLATWRLNFCLAEIMQVHGSTNKNLPSRGGQYTDFEHAFRAWVTLPKADSVKMHHWHTCSPWWHDRGKDFSYCGAFPPPGSGSEGEILHIWCLLIQWESFLQNDDVEGNGV